MLAHSLGYIYLIPFNIEGTANPWPYIDTSRRDAMSVKLTTPISGSMQMVANAYSGGVYSSEQQRIYLVPFNQATQADWHYIDCSRGSHRFVAYKHRLGAQVVSQAYKSGVHVPHQARIYLVPFSQAAETHWHYVNCRTGKIVAYEALYFNAAVHGAYQGGVYSPPNRRIYLVPFAQATQPEWHYIEVGGGGGGGTDEARVVAYAHGQGGEDHMENNAYNGGAYSPNQGRLYFAPNNQVVRPHWHYVDTRTGRVCAYEHGASDTLVKSSAYHGAIYSPEQDRIYLMPFFQATRPVWHYIDCRSERVVAYRHYLNVKCQFQGGVYLPNEKLIVLVAFQSANTDSVYKIDLSVQDDVRVFV